jgi:hypothetical protein
LICLDLKYLRLRSFVDGCIIYYSKARALAVLISIDVCMMSFFKALAARTSSTTVFWLEKYGNSFETLGGRPIPYCIPGAQTLPRKQRNYSC